MDENKKEKMNKKTLILNIIICVLISFLITIVLAPFIREGLYVIIINMLAKYEEVSNNFKLIEVFFKISLLITFALSLYISLKLRLKQKND